MRDHRYISSAVAKGRPNSVSHTRTRGAGLATYYEYDAANELLTENLMTRIDFPDDTHSYYTYDADSKRVSQRTADGYSEFIYQGPDMLKLQMERDENGDTKVQYTMGAGLEAMRRDAGGGMSSGDSSFYQYNHLGTTVALTDADESVTDTYRHDAWGVQLASTGSTVNPHTYVGQQRYYRMPEAALYHLGFRDYAQGMGRFTTIDPIFHGLLLQQSPSQHVPALVRMGAYHPDSSSGPNGHRWRPEGPDLGWAMLGNSSPDHVLATTPYAPHPFLYSQNRAPVFADPHGLLSCEWQCRLDMARGAVAGCMIGLGYLCLATITTCLLICIPVCITNPPACYHCYATSVAMIEFLCGGTLLPCLVGAIIGSIAAYALACGEACKELPCPDTSHGTRTPPPEPPDRWR
jgi:RHS repeat-associated protein